MCQCQGQGCRLCMQQGSLNGAFQQSLANQYRQAGQLASQIAPQQYQGLAAWMPANLAPPDKDYELFQKYAHLDDGELARLYIEEKDKIIQDAKEDCNHTMAIAYEYQEHYIQQFAEWCKKYRKHINPERLDKLQVFK